MGNELKVSCFFFSFLLFLFTSFVSPLGLPVLFQMSERDASSTHLSHLKVEDDLNDIETLNEEFRELVEGNFKSIPGSRTEISFASLIKDVYNVCGEISGIFFGSS